MVVCSRQRDILPLPYIPERLSPQFCQSHSAKRRLHCKDNETNRINDAFLTLNTLGGRGLLEPSASEGLGVGSSACAAHVAHAFELLGGPPGDVEKKGALAALLLRSGQYADERADLAPYASEKLSLPEVLFNPIPLVKGLPASDQDLLSNWQSTMLADPSCNDDGHPLDTSDTHPSNIPNQQSNKPIPTKPHNDPLLFASQKTYAKFLKRLYDAGMLTWKNSGRKRVEGVLGVFFVKKKDGTLRIIFDTRVLNSKFKKPPKTQLPSAAGFGNLECVSENGLQSDLFLASADVRNAFYTLEVPESLAAEFTLPPICHKYLIDCGLNIPDAGFHDFLVPCLKVLPMGWGWSLHLCQSFVANTVAKVVSADRSILDRQPGVVLRKQSDVATATYVDNFAVFGKDPVCVNRILKKIIAEFDLMKVPIHEQTDAVTKGEFVGLAFDNGKICIKKSRLWKLTYALEEVIARKHASGRTLEILLGHLTWAMMVRREALSLFVHIYPFCQNHRDQHCRIPNNVLRELYQAKSILPLLRCDVHSEWSSLVHCSDASLDGIGVCSAHFDPGTIHSIGTQAERWRYKVEGGLNARYRSLIEKSEAVDDIVEDPVVCDPDPMCSDEVDLDPMWSHLENPCDPTLRFDEVPDEVCDPKKWKVVHGRKFYRKEHITKIEGRALRLAVRHALRSQSNFNRRLLFLVDNMSLCLAICKGRSSSPLLIGAAQEIAALSLASGCRVVCRWIASERNPADGPSRGVRPDGTAWDSPYSAAPDVVVCADIVDPNASPAAAEIHTYDHPAAISGEVLSGCVPTDPFLECLDSSLPLLNEGGVDDVCVDDDFLDAVSSFSEGSNCQKADGTTSAAVEKEVRSGVPPALSGIVGADEPRTAICDAGNITNLLDDDGSVPFVGCQSPIKLEYRGAVGQSSVEFSGRDVLEGASSLNGISDFSRCQVLPAAVQPNGNRSPSTISPLRHFMDESFPRAAASTAALCGTYRHPWLAVSSKGASLRLESSLPVQDLSTAGRVRRSPGEAVDQAFHLCRGRPPGLGPTSIPGRGPDTRQDRSLRREHIVGYRPRPLHGSVSSTYDQPGRERQTVAYRAAEDHPSIVTRVRGARAAVPACMPVLPPARRRIARHLESTEDPPRGQASGDMAKRQLVKEVCQGGKSAGRACKDGTKCIGVREQSGAEPCRSLDRAPRARSTAKCHATQACPKQTNLNPDLSSKNIHRSAASGVMKLKSLMRSELLRSGSNSQVFLDLFSGTGGVSQFIRSTNRGAVSIDLSIDPDFDLNNKHIRNLIFGWISSGCIAGVFLGTPCSSWSRARHGPIGSSWGPLRSRKHILGFPNLRLNDNLKLKNGNAHMRFSAAIIKLCLECQLPCMLENPSGSYLFQARAIQILLGSSVCNSFTLDQCAFGSAWRKRTQISTWNCSECDRLNHRCSGRRGSCSFTGDPHVVLRGCSSNGKLLTALAQEYPSTLAPALGQVLLDSHRNITKHYIFRFSGLNGQ